MSDSKIIDNPNENKAKKEKIRENFSIAPNTSKPNDRPDIIKQKHKKKKK